MICNFSFYLNCLIYINKFIIIKEISRQEKLSNELKEIKPNLYNFYKKENNKTFIVRLHASSVQNVFNRIISSKLLTKEDIVNYLECIYTKEIKDVHENWESYIFKDLNINDNLNNLEELILNIKY